MSKWVPVWNVPIVHRDGLGDTPEGSLPVAAATAKDARLYAEEYLALDSAWSDVRGLVALRPWRTGTEVIGP